MAEKTVTSADYTRVSLDITFPKDRVCCQLCPLLQTYSRNQCMRTGELIPDVKGVGGWCPLMNDNGEMYGQYYYQV